MGTGGKHSGNNGDTGILAQFDGRPKARQTRAHDDYIITLVHKTLLWKKMKNRNAAAMNPWHWQAQQAG